MVGGELILTGLIGNAAIVGLELNKPPWMGKERALLRLIKRNKEGGVKEARVQDAVGGREEEG